MKVGVQAVKVGVQAVKVGVRAVKVEHSIAPDFLPHAWEWLVANGIAEVATPTELRLTPAGRDWMLAAIWVREGCPGLPDEVYERG